MKQYIAIIIAFCMAACNTNKSTDALLIEVWNNDQIAREQIAGLTRAVIVEGRTDLIDSLIAGVEAVEKVDIKNISIIDSLLRDGLPENLTPQSYKTIWIAMTMHLLRNKSNIFP